MKLKALVLMVTLVLVGAAANDQTLDGCQKACGGVPILYPFGVGTSSITGKNCFLEKSFKVTCTNATPYLGNTPVLGISITQGQVDVMLLVSRVCYDSTIGAEGLYGDGSTITSDPSLSISSKDNKFISVGCDTYGYLNSFYDDTTYSIGCLTRCYGNSMWIIDGSCSNIGCCQVDIPPGMRNISIQPASFENFNKSLSFNNCSYSFFAKNGNYTFSKSHLENLPYERVPMVVDWSVGSETCEASRNTGTYACKGNSTCVNSDTGYGYRCRCNKVTKETRTIRMVA